ncbi:MAG TPA: Crp/Fnr family transcriptional regulator [Blastocatellia bacterium]|nr:Crp/Fnr family transcriptional regulator [Blastocatellia bacterium]
MENSLGIGGRAICLSLFGAGFNERLKARKPRLFGANQIIYNIGDEGRGLYFLRSGLVKLSTISESGKEIILGVYRTGEVFGEMCLYTARRMDMAVAMEPSEAAELGPDEFLAILYESREVMYDFLQSSLKRLARSYDLIREISFDSVPVRLAKLLLRLADEFGEPSHQGVELTHFISQEELSQIVLARREVVSMALSRLRKQGLVNYNRKGRLTIHTTALKAYIEARPEMADRTPYEVKKKSAVPA